MTDRENQTNSNPIDNVSAEPAPKTRVYHRIFFNLFLEEIPALPIYPRVLSGWRRHWFRALSKLAEDDAAFDAVLGMRLLEAAIWALKEVLSHLFVLLLKVELYSWFLLRWSFLGDHEDVLAP